MQFMGSVENGFQEWLWAYILTSFYEFFSTYDTILIYIQFLKGQK